MRRFEKNKSNSIIETLTFAVFAGRAISDGMLAFASKTYMPIYASFVTIIVYMTIPLGALYVFRHNRIDSKRAAIAILPIIFLLLLIFNTYDGYSGEWITSFLAIICFAFMLQDDKATIYDYFYKTLLVCNIISLILYAAAVLNINIGFRIVTYYTGVENASYFKWFIFGVLRQGISQYRLCGVFNEPGALGTVCAFLLIINYNHAKTWEKIVLLLCTFFSFSMAGYILVFAFFLLNLIRKNRKYIFVVLILAFLFVKIPTIDYGNETLNYLARRFEITESGFRGDARYDIVFSNIYDSFIHTPKALFGYGYGYDAIKGVSTYKQWILQFGFVGFGIYTLAFVIAGLKNAQKNKECIILLVLFILSIYQRPLSISSLHGYVILFGGMSYLQRTKSEHDVANTEG